MIPVPAVTTTPETSLRASASVAWWAIVKRSCGVSAGPSTFPNGRTSTSATSLRPGTARTRSSPETAGTTPPVAGSRREAIVPPVVMTTMVGRWLALPCKAGRRVLVVFGGAPLAARDARLVGGLANGLGDLERNTFVEDAGDDVLLVQLLGRDNGGERLGGRELHRFVNRARLAIERAPHDPGECEHVVDLVRIIRAAGRDDAGEAGDLLGQHLGCGVRHREDDCVAVHRLHGFE